MTDRQFSDLINVVELGSKLATKAGRAIYGTPWLEGGRWWVHDALTDTRMTSTDFLNLSDTDVPKDTTMYVDSELKRYHGLTYPLTKEENTPPA